MCFDPDFLGFPVSAGLRSNRPLGVDNLWVLDLDRLYQNQSPVRGGLHCRCYQSLGLCHLRRERDVVGTGLNLPKRGKRKRLGCPAYLKYFGLNHVFSVKL